AQALVPAELLVFLRSALQIEEVNDLLAYRCRALGVPCAAHVIDLSHTDNLLDLDAAYLMISKIDGIKLQQAELERMGYLTA
ncbi:MAG: hypothetical protein ABI680_12105, partial [Chthoniobacteraceae bacterium]